LDSIWLFSAEDEVRLVAILAHQPQRFEEMALDIGDVIEHSVGSWDAAGRKIDGYSHGKNLRTNQYGFFPRYKTQEEANVADFQV
jgi:hypothetical protein